MLIEEEELLKTIHRYESSTVKKDDISSSTKETVLTIMYWLEGIIISQDKISKRQIENRGWIKGFCMGELIAVILYLLFLR